MKRLIPYLIMIPFMIMASPAVAHEDGSSAMNTMAGIVMHLNHYPSDSEKQTLQQIIDDTHATAGERTLAGALQRMQHKVGGDDAEKLMSLKNNPQAEPAERELADILLGIAHHPSASDQKRLQQLMH